MDETNPESLNSEAENGGEPNPEAASSAEQPVPETGKRSGSGGRTAFAVLFGVLSTAVAAAAGRLLRWLFESRGGVPPFEWTVVGLFAAFFLLFYGSLIAAGILRVRRLSRRRVEESWASFEDRRRELQTEYALFRRRVRRKAAGVILFEIWTGIVFTVWAMTFGWVSVYLGSALAAIPMTFLFARTGISLKKPDPGRFAPRSKYPELYALADRAAKAVGVERKVSLTVVYGGSVSVFWNKKGVCLLVSATYLDLMDYDELYTVFLHEMSHCRGGTYQDKLADGVGARLRWISGDRIPGTAVSQYMFCFSDAPFFLEEAVSQRLMSVYAETEADRAVREGGDVRKAASALVKAELYGDFIRRFPALYGDVLYAPEEPIPDYTARLGTFFRDAAAKHGEEWIALHEREIQSRSATHPILRNRVEALGVKLADVVLSFPESGPDAEDPFRSECVRAIADADGTFRDELAADYADQRNQLDLDPLARVGEWEQAGKPLDEETYRDVCGDLLNLARVPEAEALCDRVLSTLEDGPATAYARFMKGRILLDRDDPAGIPELYRAMELNKTYTEEAVGLIGSSCCRLGLEDELNEYRNAAPGVIQDLEDTYGKIGTLTASDRLTEEPLEGTMLQDLLAFFEENGEGTLEAVYLVRKWVTDSYFTSAFVMYFEPGTPDEQIQRIMHRYYLKLDGGFEWQFSLFLYDRTTEKAVQKVRNSRVWSRD
ncbi:MAG: hypothetical protein ILO68_07565 [Clostridia bacterium]|nr:hypothetical protein [Clostridia bacterium]